MIIALLVLIILVLLFGAAAVKGWIKSAIVGIFGFAIICAAIIWLGSFFGEDGFLYVMLGIGVGGPALLLVAAGIAKVVEGREKARTTRDAQHTAEREAMRRKPKIERLWHHLASDISSFDTEARAKARRFYHAKDVQGLRQFCREEIDRLK